MILFIIATLFPYIWLWQGAGLSFRAPPAVEMVVLVGSCIVFHAAFIMLCAKKGLCTATITAFFGWIFMGLAPLACAATGVWLWGDITYSKEMKIVKAIGYVWLFTAAFVFSYRSIDIKRMRRSSMFTRARRSNPQFIFWAALLQAVGVIASIAALGMSGLVTRAGAESYFSTSQIVTLIAQNVARPIVFFTGVYSLYLAFRERHSAFVKCSAGVLMIIGILFNLPFAVARYYSFMLVAVSMFFALRFAGMAKARWSIGVILVAGFFSSFVFDGLRMAESRAALVAVAKESVGLNVDSFFAGHLDAFEVLVYGVEYVEDRGTVAGREFLGALLFWIPRSMWPEKPLGTGPLLGAQHINILTKTDNTNLSAPLVLEGLINFGILGVIFFGVLAGRFCGFVDVYGVAPFVKGEALTLAQMIAGPCVGLWLFMLRGTLLTAFAYTTGVLIAALITAFALTKRIYPTERKPPFHHNVAGVPRFQK